MSDPRLPASGEEENDLAQTPDDEIEGDETPGEGDEAGGDQDGADAGDENAGDPEGEDDPEAVGNVERKPSRAQTRVQTALREARESKSEAAELRRRLEALEGNRGADPQAAQRQESEFWEQYERADDVTRGRMLDQRNHGRQVVAEYRSNDAADRRGFEQLMRSDASAKRLGPRVEQVLAEQRRLGFHHYTRENILDFLLGQEVRLRRSQETPRQQRAAQRRVASVTTKPGGGRGDVARTSPRGARSQDDADIALLKGMRISDF